MPLQFNALLLRPLQCSAIISSYNGRVQIEITGTDLWRLKEKKVCKYEMKALPPDGMVPAPSLPVTVELHYFLHSLRLKHIFSPLIKKKVQANFKENE